MRFLHSTSYSSVDQQGASGKVLVGDGFAAISSTIVTLRQFLSSVVTQLCVRQSIEMMDSIIIEESLAVSTVLARCQTCQMPRIYHLTCKFPDALERSGHTL